MAFQLTDEQTAVVDGYQAGERLVVDALAGSGKTRTLRACAERSPGRGGTYVAYNKAIQVEADRSFPANTLCRTAHSLAFNAVGYTLAEKLRRPRQRARDVARILGIKRRVITVNALGHPAAVDVPQLARLVTDTVGRFCHSADYSISNRHVPHVTGLGRDGQAEVADVVVGYAAAAWSDLCGPSGALKLQHDHYLKFWHLTRPVIASDVIYLDEAQDANPVISDIVQAQQHAQLILVGDRHQQLYGWRGAQDAMTGFDGRRLALTKSFRFGDAIADEANVWLAALGSNLRVVGHDPIPSTVGPLSLDDVSAVLCRTNAGTIREAVRAEDRGLKPAVVGGALKLARLAEAADELRREGRTWHPELAAFNSWDEVVDYAATEAAGENLATLVNLITTYGAAEILRIIGTLAPTEDAADVVLSTGHKAKGREWTSVQIAEDFKPNPRRHPETGELVEPEMTDEARMLAYVAVTRAQMRLDPSGLSWARPETPTAAPSSWQSSGTAASANTLEALS
ncbi:UvrD-helicase domain-containing protein [Actinomadura terrae]|uniref:UvrD-helicase domain-containing protein n=1 Tax=Actinomadura terrae TaxID=604353 RepID=UPI001FA71E1A|nr:UvrD-helicase domain-containing protein [Actinomadura terrae]